MKIYAVYYEGLWLGGCAIVIAASEYEAMKLVANDSKTVNPQSMTVKLATSDLTKPAVIYNDNGNY